VFLPSAGVTAELFAAPGEARRPAVIILHGRQGIDPLRRHYQHYAAAVAKSGIDAYLLPYYTGGDARLAQNPIAEERRAYFGQRLRLWSTLVRSAVDDILAEHHASGQIGLLGFSQGGFLSVAAANQDPRISAMTIFYGGIPSVLKDNITHLPPILELHGDADHTVPLPEGKALVDVAHGLNSSVEMVVYPGAGHGFSGASAADAERRTIAFFQQRLLVKP
jgi:carboxymethylenebutenolidase